MPRNAPPDQHVIDHTAAHCLRDVAIRNEPQNAVATNLAQAHADVVLRELQRAWTVLYHLAPSGPWQEVAGVPAQAAATPGFARFTITLDKDLPGPGWSGTSLSNARIEAVPFLKMPQGGRLFDHNRNVGDTDNHAMTSPDLAIWRDDSRCAPPAGPTRAKINFNADWSITREGVLAPGGELTRYACESNGQYSQETVEYYVTVNGYELRPAPGGAYAGIFTDYLNDAWRSQNCH